MEIVKVENLAEMTANDCYYELNGEYYAVCRNCGKPVAVDCRRTRFDLRREIVGEEEYYCNDDCRKDWFLSECPTYDDAMFLGYEDLAKEFYHEEWAAEHEDEEE